MNIDLSGRLPSSPARRRASVWPSPRAWLPPAPRSSSTAEPRLPSPRRLPNSQGPSLAQPSRASRAISARPPVATAWRAYPRYDVLVNNLGIYGPRDFFETPDDEWARYFEVNVMSGVRLSRAYLPGMTERRWGRVIFISSESALNIPADMIHYGMTKTGHGQFHPARPDPVGRRRRDAEEGDGGHRPIAR